MAGGSAAFFYYSLFTVEHLNYIRGIFFSKFNLITGYEMTQRESKKKKKKRTACIREALRRKTSKTEWEWMIEWLKTKIGCNILSMRICLFVVDVENKLISLPWLSLLFNQAWIESCFIIKYNEIFFAFSPKRQVNLKINTSQILINV